jgi:hypothetical protein
MLVRTRERAITEGSVMSIPSRARATRNGGRGVRDMSLKVIWEKQRNKHHRHRRLLRPRRERPRRRRAAERG